jgi:aryl-alcohol dehydrogenase-like predicted oxidoreductase
MEALMKSTPLDFVQVNYSLRDRAAENRLLPLALEKGIAVLANRPFAHGRLFKDVGGATPPSWATEFDCDSWAQFFLKYVVAHPAVTCAIPGMTKLAHATDNMGANFGRLPDAQLRARQEQVLASI